MHKAVLLFAVLIVSGTAFAADAPPAPQPYLSASDEPDATKFLPDYPRKGSKAKAEDQFVFDSWRKKAKNPRWTTAIADADWHTTAVLDGFSCALGVKLDATNVPKLVALIDRAQEDLGNASSNAKKYFHRDRPFVGNKKATCVDRSTVGASSSYPSGHSALGWMTALILAELAPDRAGEIVSRGRAYGESRAVCGMHWESDIETGRYVGAAVVASLHSSAAFRTDMDAARDEIAKARNGISGIGGATCRTEIQSDLKRPW